ncbi:MAG: hypothetical protein WD875_07840 [Pirellulales bacterium]
MHRDSAREERETNDGERLAAWEGRRMPSADGGIDRRHRRAIADDLILGILILSIVTAASNE